MRLQSDGRWGWSHLEGAFTQEPEPGSLSSWGLEQRELLGVSPPLCGLPARLVASGEPAFVLWLLSAVCLQRQSQAKAVLLTLQPQKSISITSVLLVQIITLGECIEEPRGGRGLGHVTVRVETVKADTLNRKCR